MDQESVGNAPQAVVVKIKQMGQNALTLAKAVEESIEAASVCEVGSKKGEYSIIKAARRPSNWSQPAKLGHVPIPEENLPFLEVAVHASQTNTSSSKWDDPPKGGYEGRLGARLTTGYMMVDTGASLTLLTKKWC